MSGSAAAPSSASNRGTTGASNSASRGVGVKASRFALATLGFENPSALNARTRVFGVASNRSDAGTLRFRAGGASGNRWGAATSGSRGGGAGGGTRAPPPDVQKYGRRLVT